MSNNYELSLSCSLETPIEVSSFFSLMEYRNNLFLSKRPDEVVHFFEGFGDRSDLIEWMKSRPKGRPFLREVEGLKEIIVIIPTSDIKGKYATSCRKEIFSKLHIIFVVSGGVPDPYYNFAHYVNAGIKKALEYSPKWIIISNDDVYKIDNISTLIHELQNLDNDRYDAVFIKPSIYHSTPVIFGPQTIFRKLAFYFSKWRRAQLRVEKRFGVVFLSSPRVLKRRLFFKQRTFKHTSFGDFFVLSSEFVNGNNGIIFDETYINGGDDVDFSLRVSCQKLKTAEVNFRIGDYFGMSLGNSVERHIRDISGYAYLNFKIQNDLHSASRVMKNYWSELFPSNDE